MMSFSDRGTGTERVPPRTSSAARSTDPATSPSPSSRDVPRPGFSFDSPSSKSDPGGISGATGRRFIDGALGATLSILMFQSGHPFFGAICAGAAVTCGFFVARDLVKEFGKK